MLLIVCISWLRITMYSSRALPKRAALQAQISQIFVFVYLYLYGLMVVATLRETCKLHVCTSKDVSRREFFDGYGYFVERKRRMIK